MITLIVEIFWLLLPAGFANMAPLLFKWIPFLGFPVDLGKKFRGKPIFGKNKTCRGFLIGVLAAIFVVFFQQFFYEHTKEISLINYREINIYLLGFLLGFGALFGDLIESFLKRQVGIGSGKAWFPFDQIDWVLGALIFASFYISISWKHFLVSIILFGLLHLILNFIGYYVGIKKTKI